MTAGSKVHGGDFNFNNVCLYLWYLWCVETECPSMKVYSPVGQTVVQENIDQSQSQPVKQTLISSREGGSPPPQVSPLWGFASFTVSIHKAIMALIKLG